MKQAKCLMLFLALCAAVPTVRAQTTPLEAAQTPSAKTPVARTESAAPKPRNTRGPRKFESAISAVEKVVGGTKITLQSGALSMLVKSTTLVFREERDLGASDLQNGDMLSLTALRGARSKISIKEDASVIGINPLIIKIGEFATMKLNKGDVWEFNRSTPTDAAALAVGQTIAVELGLRYDGDISPNRVAIIVAKPKTPRAAKPSVKETPVAITTETANAE